jgi:hypothetical protein
MLLIAGLAVLIGLAMAALAPSRASAAPLVAYRGLGTWVDIYDAQAWNDPAAAVKDMASHGVRTLYLETSNYHWAVAINKPAAMAAFILQCHARHMRVVAWYVPGFQDLAKDNARSMAAIHYRTADGQQFDSFALDIEASLVKTPSTRSARVKTLSAKIRTAVGTSYPLGGIIPSPAGMKINSSYWPGFPYKAVAGVYDVIVPMGYYTYHGDGYSQAYSETLENVRIVRETGCLGGSMYDWSTTGAADWRALANVRYNRVQSPALPREVGYTAPLGNCPSDTSHPKEVFYQAAQQSGARILHFRLWDVQTGEVRLVVNWHDTGPLVQGPTARWSRVRSIAIPASMLNAGGRNVIGFVARGAAPHWQRWGVRAVTLVEP